ncbi:MAG TPA: calcium-binding protein [Rhizobiaceae bacterium]|nr:calcium-binding protein [Rhizobiaceae bacterium]
MAIIRGDNTSEIINGTNSADTIYGYGGNDLIRGLNGNDRIYGGAGNDDIYGGLGANDLYGGTGLDWFIMTARGVGLSDDLIVDFDLDSDRIDVKAWNVSDFSQIQAIMTNDSFGDATLNAIWNGYAHRITVDGIAASELISADFVYNTSTIAKEINGTNAIDVLFGGRGADELNGFGGNDILLGGAGNDDLFGGAGNDRMVGGLGSDWHTGGSGFDRFDFNALNESLPSANRDRITDFQLDIDLIDLSTIDANALLAGNQAFTFRGTAAFTAAGQIRYNYLGSDTLISMNTDTDAAAEMQIILSGNKALIRGDFVL